MVRSIQCHDFSIPVLLLLSAEPCMQTVELKQTKCVSSPVKQDLVYIGVSNMLLYLLGTKMFHFPCLVTDLLMVTRSRSAISLWFKERREGKKGKE